MHLAWMGGRMGWIIHVLWMERNCPDGNLPLQILVPEPVPEPLFEVSVIVSVTPSACCSPRKALTACEVEGEGAEYLTVLG